MGLDKRLVYLSFLTDYYERGNSILALVNGRKVYLSMERAAAYVMSPDRPIGSSHPDREWAKQAREVEKSILEIIPEWRRGGYDSFPGCPLSQWPWSLKLKTHPGSFWDDPIGPKSGHL